jgi:pimeloyl-ACP methyl ester carboxylesterase
MSTRTLEKRTVAGLPVTIWEGTGPTVLALAGLGGSAITWGPLVDRWGDAHVVSPDLRGRGDAQGMTGPSGLKHHAEDCARILEELDLTDVVVVGHSMGAYLAPVVAQQAPGRIGKLVLIDGGIPAKLPFFMRPGLTRIAFGNQLKSVDRDYASVDAALKKARIGKMLASKPELRPEFERIVIDSCTATYRPRLDIPRAVDDAVDTFFGPAVAPALDALTVPADVILATSKKYDGQGPFISDKAVAPWRTRQPLLRVQRVPGNHVTVLFAPEVAAAVQAP